MSKLNEDVLYLIFKELQDDKKSLYSFLLVDKTWCKIIIPMLWKDPWKFLSMGKEKFLLDLIISRNDLDKGFSHKKPMFDYISFCKHLNLNEIERIIKMYDFMIFKKNEIINLFINGNAKFTHLYIPQQFNYQIHLVPGAKHCFSELKFLSCNTSINDNVLAGLIEICKSIKDLELFIELDN